MSGIYVHIPFCKQACSYCNFYFSTSPGNKNKLIDALRTEIELSKNYLNGEPVETLYIGGGTPSLLEKADLFAIIDKIETYHDLGLLKEFTLETNPDDLSNEKIKILKELSENGLQRLSIGVQSFSDEDLRYMNRAHTAEEAIISVKRAQDAGFENITIDLIYGTPTMSDEQWEINLAKAFQLKVPHISSYALTIEPKTTLEKNIGKGLAKPVDEATTIRHFKILMETMKANGYEQYEISNFAKPGKHAIHNSNYWFGKSYLGIGPSAHSYNGTTRRWNVANNVSYIESISKGVIPYQEEILTASQQLNEKIMTSLRTQWGLRIAEYGTGNMERIKNKLKEINRAHYSLADGVLTLTDTGKLFADRIASELFLD